MLALLERIIGIVVQVLGVLFNVQQLTQHAAQEHEPFALETIASNAANTVNHPTYGNAAIKAALDAEFALLNGEISLIHSSVDYIQGALTPYPPNAAANAQAVWSYNNGGFAYGGFAAWYQLELAHRRLVQIAHDWQAPSFGASLFTLYTPTLHVGVSTEYLPFRPAPDFDTIGDYATVLDWLTATEPNLTWAYDSTSGLCVSQDAVAGDAVWTCLLTQADFALLGAKGRTGPPVWPGLANVDLGTPVALATDLTITTPMHGVLVEITAVAAKYNTFKFSYDGLTSYRKLGALTFLTDRGDAEQFQFLSFELAIYCPKEMAEAASLKLECAVGTTGTVTPWLRKQA